MSTVSPPHVVVSWAATSMAPSFGQYNVYRRRRGQPVAAWQQIAAIMGTSSNVVNANVEKYHTRFIDYEAGWCPNTVGSTEPAWQGEYGSGWEYAVTAVNSATGFESTIGTAQVGQALVSPDTAIWVTSNVAPYLNVPFSALVKMTNADKSKLAFWEMAGRDQAVTRTALELPYRTYNLVWEDYNRLGEDYYRIARAGAASGQSLCMLLPKSDRIIGSFDAPGTTHSQESFVEWQTQFVETQRYSAVADFNSPCGFSTNGVGCVSTASTAALNPSGSFTLFCSLYQAGGTSYLLSKGNVTVDSQYYGLSLDGFGLLHLQMKDSASNVLDVHQTSGGVPSGPHVIVVTVRANTVNIYLDGVLQSTTGSQTTNGTVSNTVAFLAGANNGASPASFLGAADVIRSWGMYSAALDDPVQLYAGGNAVSALTQYLQGVPGVRPPALPLSAQGCWYDMRDTRCWQGGTGTTGSVVDVSGNGLNGTLTSSPAIVGYPWPLATLDSF